MTDSKIRHLISALHPKKYGSYLASLLGTWTAPNWLRRCGASLNRWRQQKPSAFWGTLLVLVLTIAGARLGYHWYQNRPQPLFVTVTVEQPGVTPNSQEGLNPRPASLIFGASAAQLEQVGKSVTSGITITPEIAGNWLWQDDKTLTFTPLADWPAGQSYVVRFATDFFPPHLKLATLEYEMTAPAFEAAINAFAFYQDPTDAKINKLVGTLVFSHPVTAEAIKSHVTMATQSDPTIQIEDGKVRQRMLMSLGRAGEDRMDDVISAIGKYKDVLTVLDLAKNISVSDTFILGPLLVLERMFEQSGIDRIRYQKTRLHDDSRTICSSRIEAQDI